MNVRTVTVKVAVDEDGRARVAAVSGNPPLEPQQCAALGEGFVKVLEAVGLSDIGGTQQTLL